MKVTTRNANRSTGAILVRRRSEQPYLTAAGLLPVRGVNTRQHDPMSLEWHCGGRGAVPLPRRRTLGDALPIVSPAVLPSLKRLTGSVSGGGWMGSRSPSVSYRWADGG